MVLHCYQVSKKKKQQQQKSMKIHSSWQTLSAKKSLISIPAFGFQKELEHFYHPCFIASELTRKTKMISEKMQYSTP